MVVSAAHKDRGELVMVKARTNYRQSSNVELATSLREAQTRGGMEHRQTYTHKTRTGLHRTVADTIHFTAYLIMYNHVCDIQILIIES